MPFKNITGQDRQIGILVQALEGKTLAHALLFTGIPGIGKTTTAYALAKALHCKTARNDFCDACISCKKIAQGTHPDLVLIEPEGDAIKINQIRKMQEQVSYTSYEGHHKIVLIDKAERMNIQSSNCLLKTLEEPPPHTVLILLTSVPYQLPSTVRSRCQRIMFQPLPEALIEEVLENRCGEEEGEKVQLIASLAGGSLGRALRWTENGLLQERKELLATLSRLHTCSPTTLFKCAELLGEDKELVREKLTVITCWLRDLLLLKATSQENHIINKDLIGEARAAASRLSWFNLFEQTQVITEVQTAVQSNVNARLAMETMLFKLSR
jgi:DNA polymerase-3 subunit delta'